MVRFRFLLAFTAVAATAFGIDLTPEEQGFLRDHPVWRLAGAASPPFQWIDAEGEFRGVGAEYRDIIEKQLGVKLRVIPANTWPESVEQLRRRECDISLLTAQTPEREQFLAFTQPLLALPLPVLTRTHDRAIKSLADLAGRRVAVARHWPIHERLQQEHPEIVLMPRDDVGSAIVTVALGDADAYVGDLASATQAIERLGIRNLKLAAETSYVFPFRVAVRKDWPIAVELLDKVIAAIPAEEHAAIRRRYISLPSTFSFRSILVFGLPLLIGSVMLTLLIVNRRLAREVARRNEIEAALRESEERWSFALEGSDAGVWDWNVKTNDMFFSRRWKMMLGFEVDELEGRFSEWVSRIHPEDLDPVLETIQRHLRGETPSYEIEQRVRAKDGSYRWILARGRVVSRDQNGAPMRMVGTQSDVTERKDAEQALKAAKEFAEKLIQTANAMVLGLDTEGNITIFNRAAEQITGYKREELIGRNWWELLVPGDRFSDAWAAIGPESTGKSMRYEDPILTKSGEERYIVWQSGVIREGGKSVGTVSFGIDITERRRAEEELRRNEEKLEETVRIRTAALEAAEHRLRELTNNIPGAVHQFVRRTDGTFAFEFCSKGMETMTGVRPEDAMRDVKTVWAMIHPDDLAELVDKANHSAETLTRYIQDLRICHRDGRSQWIHAESEPQRRPDGSTLWNGSIMDVTERKRLEEELAVAKDAAESANKAKSAFLANMSHEIRTPMNAILGFTQLMLRDGALTPAQRQHLDTISRSGEHLLALINDILEMSKIEAGQVRLNVVNFDLYGLLDDLDRMSRFRAEARHLQFSVERAEDLPQYVKADEGKLRQIFINLVGNALKFTERGGVVVRVSAANGRLRGEVEDTGSGIAPADLPRLFREFQQAEAGLRAGIGTGLGLAISRQFARLMGGDMGVESELGRGTRFHFEIPVEPGEHIAAGCRRDERRVLRLQPEHANYRLLIVDDVAENRAFLDQLLRPVGFDVQAVADGEKALEAFADWDPQLVLTDLRMPGMDGLELTRRIRKLPDGTLVRILVVTASVFEENRREAIDAGADEFLRKPFLESELFEKIGRLTGVAFVYADESSEPERSARTARPGPAPLSAAELSAAIPEGLRTRLREAALRADFDEMLAVVAEVEPQAPAAAADLRCRIERFDYRSLLAALGNENVAS